MNQKVRKTILWVVGVIAAAIIGWLVTGLLDGAFKPLTEEEIIQLMNNARSQTEHWR